MRLDKFLSETGAGTRSTVKQYVKAGRVSVNGVIEKKSDTKIDENRDKVVLDGRLLIYSRFVYYMLNKPAGVVSATEDKKEETVLKLINADKKTDLFPVGRLDKDTEGLLLITNDGDMAHLLLSPRHHVDKLYFARVSGRITDSDIEAFREGLTVDEELTCLPADLRLLGAEKGQAEEDIISLVEVIIHEGKFHQIKRMFHAIGKEVLYLKRLAMGPLKLDESLKPGEARGLTTEEIDALYLTVGRLEDKSEQ